MIVNCIQTVVVVIGLQIVVGSALADMSSGPSDCAPALRKDVVVHLSSANQQYAYLSTIDKTEFDELKAGGSASLSVPIAADLVKASADFNEFKQHRTSFFQQVGYAGSAAQSQTDISMTTSPQAYSAFDQCMATLARNHVGFYAWKVSENKDSVSVSYYYQAPPGGSSIALSGSVIHGSVGGVIDGQIFPSGYSVLPNSGGTITIIRKGNPGDTLTATIVGSGYAGSVIESTFIDQPQVELGDGEVRVEVTDISTVDAGDISVTSGQTRNNSNWPCYRGGPCSDDGKWRADRVELQILASPGISLSNPRKAGAGGGVPWAAVDRLVIEADGSAHLILRTWSLPTVWTLFAHQTKQVRTTTTTAVNHTNFKSGGIATFLVPDTASKPTILLNYKGSNIPVAPGSDAPDGSLKYLAKIPSGSGTYYVYKVY